MALTHKIFPSSTYSSYGCMKSKHLIFIVGGIQILLLGIELLTRYDTFQRQVALAVTNVATFVGCLLLDRWLRRRGAGLSAPTWFVVAGAVWLDALGNFQHLYGGFWWWDRLTHTVGGMALSALFIDLFLALRRSGKLAAGWAFAAWQGVLVGQLLGSVYEVSEWLGDMWFKTERVRGPYDTPHDLFQNLIGGLLMLAIMRLSRRKPVVGN